MKPALGQNYAEHDGGIGSGEWESINPLFPYYSEEDDAEETRNPLNVYSFRGHIGDANFVYDYVK